MNLQQQNAMRWALELTHVDQAETDAVAIESVVEAAEYLRSKPAEAARVADRDDMGEM